MQTKFQLLPLPCCFACLRFFCTKTCFANCFFVWLPCGCSQLCVCKVLSEICCFHHVGTLLRRHFAFLTMHFCCFTTQQIRFSVFACVFNLSTAKNCVCSFLCFSKHLCVAKIFCVLFGIGQNLSAGKGSFCNVLHLLNTTCKENLTSPQFIDNFTQDIQGIKKTALSRFFFVV